MTGVGRPKNSIRVAVRIRSPPVGGFELRCVEARPAYAGDGQRCGWVTLEEKIILPGATRRSASVEENPNIAEWSKR